MSKVFRSPLVMLLNMFSALLSLLCLQCHYQAALASNLPLESQATDTNDIASKRSTNATLSDWPPPTIRYPLFNYEDGFLIFRDYGPVGTAEDGRVLTLLLDAVININQMMSEDYSSPSIAIHIPDTNVFFQTESTTAPGFEAMTTKLAVAALYGLKTLASRNSPRTMKIDVHDGYLGYGPWIIETVTKPRVTKPRVRNMTDA